MVTEGLDVTQGMVQLWSGDKLVSEQQTVSGFVYWPGLATGEYRLRLTVPGFVSLDEPVTVPAAGSIYAVNPEIVALAPDAAFADAQKLDLTKTFFPFQKDAMDASSRDLRRPPQR